MILNPEAEAQRLYDKFHKQLRGPALNYALLHELTQNIAMSCVDEFIRVIQMEIEALEACRIIPHDSIKRLNAYRKTKELIKEIR